MTEIKALLEEFPDASQWTLGQKKIIFKLCPDHMWPELIKAGFTLDGLKVKDVGYGKIPIEVVPEDKIEKFFVNLNSLDRKKVLNDIINNKIPFSCSIIKLNLNLLIRDGHEDKIIEWDQNYNFLNDGEDFLNDGKDFLKQICNSYNLKTKLIGYLLDKFYFSDKVLSYFLALAIKNGHIDTIKQLLDRTLDFDIDIYVRDCYRLPDTEILTLLYNRIPDSKKLTIYLIKCYASCLKNVKDSTDPYQVSVLYEFFLEWLDPKEISAIIKSL